MASQTRKLYVFTHTHWDREWYQPFETFRAQLLGLVRFLLPRLKAGTMPRFYLDGQAVILEDVLAIEPEHAETIKQLMAEGKLSAGPWYVLPDEMLVSGESLIRNLSAGLRLTRQFGEPAMIGYCPDTFGHSQDLPNILNGFGIKNAFLWRGVPLLEMGPVFWWNAPDGSRVLGYHLTRGYYQTGFHELGSADVATPQAINAFTVGLKDWVGLASGTNGGASPFYKLIGGALMPIGADHVAPPPDLGVLIDNVNETARKDKIQLEIVPTTLAEFIQMVEQKISSGTNVVQAVDGELRFNRAAPFYERAYLLPGVLSTRLYLKRANRLSEHRLARVCEPLQAIMLMAGRSKPLRSELDYAWKLLLKNHPHDSICGCSVDAVHDEMMTRTAKLNDLLDSMFERIAADACGRPTGDSRSHQDPNLNHDRLTVFNISGASVSAPVPMQWMEPIGSTRFDGPSSSVQIESKKREDRLFSGWGSVPYYKEVDVLEGWLWAEDVPSLGFRSFELPPHATDSVVNPQVSVSGNRIFNGHLAVNISTSGRLTVTHGTKTYRLHQTIRDVGDGGDSYNFDPLPDDKPIEAKVTGIRVGKRGPLVGSIVVSYEIDLPDSVVPDGNFFTRNDPGATKIQLLKRSRAKSKHEISLEISLKRGVPIIFFDASWENRARDHRLEVCLDTGESVETSYSENHFSVVRRFHKLRAPKEKLPVAAGHEAPPDRYPAQRFVAVNGQVILNTGLPEYGVEGSQITLTMLRAVSYLSRQRLWTRGGGAGPYLDVPGANCLGPNKCSYGWAPLSVPFTDIKPSGGGDDWMHEAYKLAELYDGTLFGALGRGRFGTDAGADAKSFIHLDNKNIRLIACYPNDPKSVVVRLLNVCNEDQKAKLHLNCDVKSLEQTNYDFGDRKAVKLSKTDACRTGELIFSPYQVKTLVLTLGN